MPTLIEHIPSATRANPRTILVVGAEAGPDLAEFRQRGHTRLILAQAHPGLASELERKIDPGHGEEVWPLAITPAAQAEATLHVLNNPRHSSLLQPLQPHPLLPNLQPAGELQVPARAIADAVDLLQLAPGSDHALVINTPELAHALLTALPADKLHGFTHILLRTCSEALHQGGDGTARALELLEQSGFQILAKDENALPPFGRVLLKQNPCSLQNLHLQRQVAEQNSRIARLQTELDASQQALTAHGEHIAQHEAAQNKAAQDKAQLDAQLKATTQQRDEQAKLAEQRKAELEAGKQALAAHGERIRQLEAAQDALAKEKAQFDAQLKAVAQQRDAQTKLAEQRKTEMETNQRQLQERSMYFERLETEQTDQGQRQAQLGREMLKAEAQIELIKDLLLREPGL